MLKDKKRKSPITILGRNQSPVSADGKTGEAAGGEKRKKERCHRRRTDQARYDTRRPSPHSAHRGEKGQLLASFVGVRRPGGRKEAYLSTGGPSREEGKDFTHMVRDFGRRLGKSKCPCLICARKIIEQGKKEKRWTSSLV